MNSEEQLLNKRKFNVRFVVILMVTLLILFNLGSWLFFNKIEKYLENELTKRLYSIADIAANYIDISPIINIENITTNSSDLLFLQAKLQDFKSRYELEGAYIVDPDYHILGNGNGNFEIGDKLFYIQQDSVQLLNAWKGQVVVSPIHIVAGNRFKTAYAPLTNDYTEIIALLVLDANAEFFQIIRLFSKGLIVGGIASIGAIILFSFFLAWSINLFINTHDSLRKTEKLAMLGQMAASVAHEIRNPLGIIKATADVLKSKYENKEQPDELFGYIGAEVSRLNTLVNDFLSFAREPKLNLNKGNIEHIIKKAVAAFERELFEHTISIKINVINDIEKFNFDEEKIQQILLNLLINAAQAIESRGEVVIDISKYKYHNRSYAEIKIYDDGKGIDGDLNKIFEPFYTTKSSGSGLGLAITKQIVEKHGGWIDVKSILNQGTTISFYLAI